MRQITRAGRGVFGIAVLCALGFGAAEALAEPVQASRQLSCTFQTCSVACVSIGAQSGYCNFRDGGDGSCECIWW